MTTAAIIATVSGSLLLVSLCLWMRYRWFLYNRSGRREVPVTPRRLLCSLYAISVFLVMVYLLALPVTFLYFPFVKKKNGRRLYKYHCFLRWSAEFIVNHIPGIDYTYRNRSGETFERPAVIICNHQGHFDLMCIMMTTPRLVVLTNDWVWHNPLYGWIIKRAEFYPVSNGLDANLPRLKSLVDRGYSVVIFPEGTRSGDCRILRFHSGAFYLAGRLGVDIVPMVLHGVGHVIPKFDFMLRQGHMYLEVDNRIKVGPDGDELYTRRLTRSVRRWYVERYDKLREELETALYFKQYVKYKYRYLPTGGYRRCSRLLESHDCYRQVVDRSYRDGSTVVVRNASIGVLPWLLALVHPSCRVVGVVSDDKDLAVAHATSCHPANLTFVSDFNEPCDVEIKLDNNGTVKEIITDGIPG